MVQLVSPTPSLWPHLVLIHPQVDDNQGVLLNTEKEDSLSSPTKSALKRQTATAQLKGQYEASVKQKKGNRARQSGAEQGKEVNGAILPGQSSFQSGGYPHQPSNQTLTLPQPYSSMQSHHNKNLTLPSNTSADLQKVCRTISQHAVYAAYWCLSVWQFRKSINRTYY